MDDKTRIEIFLKRVEELKNTKIVREGYDSGFTLKWTKESGVLNFQFNQPDEDLFRSLLLSLRHFLQEKEPTFINRIYNICHRCLTNEKHRNYLVKSRKFLNEAMKSTGVHLNIDQKHFSPSYVWDIYINGLYFHGDAEKSDVILKLSEHEKNLVKNELYGFVNASIKQIIYVSNIVQHAILNKGIKFEERSFNLALHVDRKGLAA